MEISITHKAGHFTADLSRGIDLSTALGDPQRSRSAWQVPPVRITPVQAGDWTGSVEAGAPINFFDIAFNPHGNGTHTESYGHIARQRYSVNAALQKHHFLAALIVQEPERNGRDRVLSRAGLEAAWQYDGAEALIVRSGDYPLPHDFSGSHPPYFEPEAMQFLVEKGVQHLLTDLPSVDPEEDGGALAAHKAFWQFPGQPRAEATISELLYIPPAAKPGWYWLNLQTAPFANDATPSRPVIFPLERKK